MPDRRLLIVGGAEKAGTTSLYSYLAGHPGICASTAKETDYFRGEAPDLAGYRRCFKRPANQDLLCMEASPGYLAEAERVAPRLARVVPHARLVFLLRDPLDRLRSSYRFYQGRLHLPADMSLDAFVEACLAFEEAPGRPRPHGIQDWHLGALRRGRYELALPPFYAALPSSQILLLHYDDLRLQPGALMARVCDFAGLDAAPYADHAFARENVGFQARHRGLQRLAIAVNDGLQGFWRAHPGLKHRLLRVYKSVNEQAPVPSAMTLDPALQARLEAYYADTRRCLAGVDRLATVDA